MTRAETIHLTLAFLGAVPPGRTEAAIAAARRVRAGAHAMRVEQGEFWGHNRIVWVGPSETPRALADLAASLRAELAREDFALEKRPFAAHVTLIRKAQAGRLPEFDPVEWPVREFVLVRSRLLASGSRYEVLERFALAPR